MKRNVPILVTGANGLAGSAIVEHLHNEMFTCVMTITRTDCNLKSRAQTLEFFRSAAPEYIIHTAATVYGLGGNMANQAKSILDNTLINTNVIEAAHECGVKKIVVMGTNAAYPWPTELPFKEENIYDGRPDAGEFGYGHAKRHMLAMLEAFYQSYGMEYSYIISGNLYGPRDRFDPVNGHVLPSLIRKFHEAKKTHGEVTIWGDGSATRDFLYVKDLARIVRMLMSTDIKPGAMNIGSGWRTSIRDVADHLRALTGLSAARVNYDTSKPTGRPDCYADLSRLFALGFTPAYDIETGLAETWQWFENAEAKKPTI
jgi:GDP-L-fucose synthase